MATAFTSRRVTYTTQNAMPFASANDPRVPVLVGSKPADLSAEDGLTPFFLQQIWKNRDDPVPMVSGIDARLVEAEARLNASDIAGMMTILNALRAAPPTIGHITSQRRWAALARPGDQDRRDHALLP